MILVLGGTTEGRELAKELHTRGHKLLLSSVTRWGASLVSLSLEKRWGALDRAGLAELIAEQDIKLVVDATHPFAAAASRNAMTACQEMMADYLRLERPATPLPRSDLLHIVDNFDVGAEQVFCLGRRALLTIGSRHLAPFLAAARKDEGEVVVRVLPQAIAHCRALGIPDEYIITSQGVESVEQNLAQFKRYAVRVVVCKDSGPQGGTPQKITATTGLGLPLVVIRRPPISYPHQVSSVQQALDIIEEGRLCQLARE